MKEQEDHNFLGVNKSRSQFRPKSAAKPGKSIPQQAISAFDQFNRDILDHKVSNESVKRLKPKFALSRTRIQSANKRAPVPFKSTGKFTSANSSVKNSGKKTLRPGTAFKKSSKKAFLERVEQNGIINVNIPM